MSPLWWMQSTAPHWTVMLEEVTPDSLTEVGAADGAVCERFRIEQREDTGNSRSILTSGHCGGCSGV